MSDYHRLMTELYAAKQMFDDSFYKWWKTQKKPHEKRHEPQEVSAARNAFIKKFDNFHYLKIASLDAEFREHPLKAINEVIEFLSVDIACHRCGYKKEYFLTKLKSVFLTEIQKTELRKIVLKMCRNPHYRREFSEWARLMIKIADQNFIKELNNLTKSPNNNVYRTAKWLQNKILENRKDLNFATA